MRKIKSRKGLRETLIMKDLDNHIKLEGKSLCMFHPESRIRKFFAKIVVHHTFEVFILMCVIFSACLIAFDNPLN